MKKTLIYIVGALMLLYPISVAANHVSGGGRNPPKTLSDRHKEVISRIVPYLKKVHPKEDPVEIVAIAMVETNLKEGLTSHTGDYGLLQVNCKIHKKKLANRLGIKNCRKDMFIMNKNVESRSFSLATTEVRDGRVCHQNVE